VADGALLAIDSVLEQRLLFYILCAQAISWIESSRFRWE
jgi:hypothetical protein